MTVRISSTKPRRCGSVMGYALHACVVTVRGATAEQLAALDDIAASFAGTQRDAMHSGRYRVRQASMPDGQYRYAGGADLDDVRTKTEQFVRALRHVIASSEEKTT